MMQPASLSRTKMTSKSAVLFLALSVLLFSTAFALSDGGRCVYLIYVQTGTVARAGTHSTISLQLTTAEGEGISVANLEEWGGLMGPNYNFFETGNLDIFTGMGPCLTSPICSLNLTSDGSGPYHGWYCDYVEVSTTGVGQPCQQQRFPVEQWLARDQEPFSLTAVKDYCSPSTNSNDDGNRRRSSWTSVA